jgi:hypothetical protein
MASPLSPAQIITVTITIFLAVNGAIGVYVNNTLSRQNTDIRELRDLIVTHMSTGVSRSEAEMVHKGINDHINRIEQRDKMLEIKVDAHLQSDNFIHERNN